MQHIARHVGSKSRERVYNPRCRLAGGFAWCFVLWDRTLFIVFIHHTGGYNAALSAVDTVRPFISLLDVLSLSVPGIHRLFSAAK